MSWTHQLQLGDSPAIAGQRRIRLAAAPREARPLPVPAERKLGRRGLLGGERARSVRLDASSSRFSRS